MHDETYEFIRLIDFTFILKSLIYQSFSLSRKKYTKNDVVDRKMLCRYMLSRSIKKWITHIYPV